MKSKAERDRMQKGSMAEEFRLSSQDKFPTLQAKYWANPNSQKGETVVCSYASPVYTEVHQSTGN